MGLALSVGYLEGLEGPDSDPEGAEWFREALQHLNAFLRKQGLPEHHEPTTLPRLRYRRHWCSFPYSFTHHLRRAVAYARRAPDKFAAIDREADPTEDEYLDRELSVHFGCHLICHSDCEGYYVPLDFPEPLYSDDEDKIPGCMVGSSVRLLAELRQAATLLEIALDADGRLSDPEAERLKDEAHRYHLERMVWFAFYEVAQASVDHKSLIVFR
jgi:hypothetical protein